VHRYDWSIRRVKVGREVTKSFSYVVDHDTGFAPNSYNGFCTLVHWSTASARAAAAAGMSLNWLKRETGSLGLAGKVSRAVDSLCRR
jgi:hypothetical protein